MKGLGGNDAICGGKGNDTLIGGGGDDGLAGEEEATSLPVAAELSTTLLGARAATRSTAGPASPT